MQKTKSYWRSVVVAGVVGAFIATACTVTTSTDVDDDDDQGGAGTSSAGKAGSATAGAGTAGASGTAGTGTAGAPTAGTGGSDSELFECDTGEGGAMGTPYSCAPADPNNDCQKCLQAKCCAEYGACYAYEPGNQCGWGGPAKLPSGEDYPGGEALCIQYCIQEGVAMSGTEPDETLIRTCAGGCGTTLATGGTKECGSIIGLQTGDLIGCMSDNCSKVCFGPLD